MSSKIGRHAAASAHPTTQTRARLCHRLRAFGIKRGPSFPYLLIYNRALSISNFTSTVSQKSTVVGAVLHSERNTRIALLALASLAFVGCGSNYRPVVSSINPVGPAGQPTKYAVAISSTGATTPGIATLIDFSGDTELVTALIGANPKFLALDTSGSTSYTLNGDGTINSFGVTSTLIQSQVNQSTLPAGADPSSITSQGASLYITLPGLDQLGQLTGVPPAIKQQLPTGANTVYTVAAPQTPRAYALVQNGASPGHVSPIETTTQTLDSPITVGVAPTYGVMTPDDRRAFILNKGSNTVTVLNVQKNQIDSFAAQISGTIPVGTAPVWADFAPTLNQLLIANQGDGTTAGSVSIISIPLCTSTTVVSNPNCDVNNPVDAEGFGTVLANIPVGVNPQQIAVLQDGTQAFVSNAGNAAAGIAGSVSVINLTTQTVVATIPAALSVDPADGLVHGHPGFIAATTGTPTGKVYVTAPDSNDLTVIRTDTDVVLTHLPLQGAGVMVRVNQP